MRGAARQRLLDGLARARNGSRAAAWPGGWRTRTAGRPSRLASSWRMPSGVSWLPMTRAETPSAQAEAETRSAPDRTAWPAKSPAASLSSMRRSAVAGIRHAQQRFGQHHEGEALAGRERVFVEEILDIADAGDAAGGAGADRRRPAGRRGDRCAPRHRAYNGAAVEEFGRELLVRRRIGRAEQDSTGHLRRGIVRVHRRHSRPAAYIGVPRASSCPLLPACASSPPAFARPRGGGGGRNDSRGASTPLGSAAVVGLAAEGVVMYLGKGGSSARRCARRGVGDRGWDRGPGAAGSGAAGSGAGSGAAGFGGVPVQHGRRRGTRTRCGRGFDRT